MDKYSVPFDWHHLIIHDVFEMVLRSVLDLTTSAHKSERAEEILHETANTRMEQINTEQNWTTASKLAVGGHNVQCGCIQA